MISWLHAPENPLISKYIECYWFLERTPDNDGSQYPKLNPDPCAHLIIAPEVQDYHYALSDSTQQGQGSHWLCPHSQTYQMDHSKPFVILGIKFHPGALYALGISATQPACDQVYDLVLSDLFDDELFNSEKLFTNARTNPVLCQTQLEHYLIPLLEQAKPDRHSELVHQALPLLNDTPISQLGDLLHCSQRTLERSFLRVTGITLKQCQSMNKLDALLTSLYQQEAKDIDWTNVALEFGFSDQPHLIRYLKSSIGVTPKQYAKQRDLVVDVYGGVESI
ncbi:helix-turn-helix domain-containing protein [Photobacterium minamisatsumaniensis]|uniref:helix-turn-helix domain-containing protein n=1 Tax=Photobacterium minamisatsumaniensis TaxID=2910233 RepID=UPI003D10BA96